jgi:methylmalonyl-CoA mutase N-terminal domain/subunit
VEEGERIVVGVNKFRDDEVHTPDLQRIDPTAERGQVDRVRRLRASRDNDAWARSLDRLAEAANGTENLLPLIIDAVKADATLGEISDRLRVAFGEHRELITV